MASHWEATLNSKQHCYNVGELRSFHLILTSLPDTQVLDRLWLIIQSSGTNKFKHLHQISVLRHYIWASTVMSEPGIYCMTS